VPDSSEESSPASSREASLRPFLLCAYALTWFLLGPFFYGLNVVNGGEMSSWLWAIVPFAFLGGWGPTLAALIVTARDEGRSGVRKLLGSLARWRVSVRWYVLVFVFPPAVTALALLIADRGLGSLRAFDPAAALGALPVAYLLALPFGPELGWRGFALPRLLSRFGAVRASLVLGVLWTFWHVPMMLWAPGASIPSVMGLSAVAVAVYLVQTVSETLLMTWLYLRTKGSVLLAVLAHLTFNTAESVVFGGLAEPSAETERAVYLTSVALLAAVATLAAWRLAGSPENFARGFEVDARS